MQAGHTAPSPEVVQAGSHSASSKGIRGTCQAALQAAVTGKFDEKQ